MKESVLSEKSLDFAGRILILAKRLRKEGEFIVSNQVGRSGTSVGANIREAQFASSRADFIAKMYVALKEANETDYWLELLRRTNEITDAEFDSLTAECTSIRAMLIASIKTAKDRDDSDKKDSYI